jgi:nucleoside-diphosphate-sugar epimerase
MFMNTVGSLNVLEAARRAQRAPWIVLGSTREVQEVRLSTEQVLFQNASGVYGLSKLCAELLAERYARDYGLRVLTLRFSDVYGSTRDNMDRVLPKLAMRALRGEDLSVTDSPHEHDFTHYEDTIGGIVGGASFIAMQDAGTYKVATLCTGRGTTIRELAEVLRSQTGGKSAIRTIPAAEFDPFRTTMLRNDTQQARRLFSFVAKIPLEVGIDQTLNAYRCLMTP